MGNPVPNVALLGLGRTGRAIFRTLYDRADVRLQAVSDAADRNAIAYLLQFDTQLGRLPVPVTIAGAAGSAGSADTPGSAGAARDNGDALQVGERRVRLVPAAAWTKAPETIPWGEMGIDTVIDASGRPRNRAEAERHLAGGARRVILCSAPAEAPDFTVAGGLNDGELRREHRIVACASPAVQAAVPAAALLGEAFGIRRAFLTTIEAFGDEQRLADVPDSDARRGRAAAESIIPQHLAAVAGLESLLPALAGKLTGLGMNVPVPDGSALDLVCWHDRPVTVEGVNAVMRQAAADPRWAGVLAYEEAPIVSSDVLHSGFSATFDSLSTMILAGNVSKTLTWFDTAWSFAQRVADVVGRLHALDTHENEAEEKP